MDHKLIISTQMTVDAVIDQTDAWFVDNPDHAGRNREELYAADALLLGRVTYEGLAQFWPKASDDTGFADRINAVPKYVASRGYDQPMSWNATLLDGEVAAAVTELKKSHNLLVYGCGELAYTLARAGLVDEIRLGVHPTVFRQGTRLFAGDEPVPLELVSATGFRSGFAELVYRPRARS
jgi:dihydrofolate reductase